MYTIWDDDSTIDRYTAVFYPSGDYIAMSGLPHHPQGFCQHGSGINVKDIYHDPDYKCMRCYLGKRIKLEDLPEECQAIVLKEDAEYKAESAYRLSSWETMEEYGCP